MVHSVTLKSAQLAVVSHKKTAEVAAPQPNVMHSEKPTTQNISLATALAQKGPPFDAARVASLQAAIASGKYRIDLGAIADGVMRFGTGAPA
nr:flagellar biosynthesis anti-sigma factor FlgM [uncultured Sphingorhabdus sp.]